MIPTRRSFLVGLGAAITAVAIPSVGAFGTLPRSLPPIALTGSPGWPLTLEGLMRAVQDIYRQVAALEPLHPTHAERTLMAAQIDEALWQIKPIGVQILIDTPLEKMLSGEFTLREIGPGTVVIS